MVDTDGVVADLRALDRALERVVAAIPWAERSGNRVVWGPVEIADAAPAPPPGVADLFERCERIDAADVDNGWFVHAPRPVDEHDGSVPHRIAGRGRCWPLGSDGGGSWFVVDDDGVVLLLRPGALAGNEYRPSSDDDVVPLASTVAGFVSVLRVAALAMADRSEPATATVEWWRERLADVDCEPASDDEIERIATEQEVALPAAYAAFLRVAGRRCGELWLGSDAFVPALFGIREHADELMRCASLELAPTDVVIGLHQGYEVLLLHGGGVDPEVRRFAEGDSETIVVATTFSSLVLDALGT